MKPWKLIWIIMFYTCGYQLRIGCCQEIWNGEANNETVQQNHETSQTRIGRSSPTNIVELSFLTTAIPQQPVKTSEKNQDQQMARTFPSSNKYWSHNSKNTKHIYSSSRRATGRKKPRQRKLSVNAISKSATKKNATAHHKNLKELLTDATKAYLFQKLKSQPSFTQLYSALNHNPSTALIKRNSDLEVVKDDYQDYNINDETSLVPSEKPRTGLILASVVGITEAIIVVSLTLGFGGLIFAGTVLLIKLFIKGLLLAMVTIYLL